jgi:hypothetical protein
MRSSSALRSCVSMAHCILLDPDRPPKLVTVSRRTPVPDETAGEHFAPREVIELMVNLLFAEDDEVLAGARPVRTT